MKRSLTADIEDGKLRIIDWDSGGCMTVLKIDENNMINAHDLVASIYTLGDLMAYKKETSIDQNNPPQQLDT